MARRIDTVESRLKLKPRHAPHWQRLSKGCHIGYRKLSSGSSGTWIARAYDPLTGKQTTRSLGSFEDRPAHERFDAAKKEAEVWFAHLGKGGSTEAITVRKACSLYVEHLRTTKGESPANDAASRFRRWVDKDKLADIELPKLTRPALQAWRKKLAGEAVVIDPHARKPRTRERSPSSVNRDMTALRAALNFAFESDYVTTDAAWRAALRPIRNADRRREDYLELSQRASLLKHAPADLALFLRGLAELPLRPGALAALTVANFNKKLGVLTVGKDKAGRDRRIKLPENTAAFLEAQSKDKLPAAPLLAQANGAAWNKDIWKKPVKEAVKAAGLRDTVTAYTFRHSAITDLVVTGKLDLLTVARISGTSVSMIERHYGHLREDHAAAALAVLSDGLSAALKVGSEPTADSPSQQIAPAGETGPVKRGKARLTRLPTATSGRGR